MIFELNNKTNIFSGSDAQGADAGAEAGVAAEVHRRQQRGIVQGVERVDRWGQAPNQARVPGKPNTTLQGIALL